MKKLLFVLLLILSVACQLQEIETPVELAPISSYKWVKSLISPASPIHFTLYTQDDNGNLYGYGYQNEIAIFKLIGNDWVHWQDIEEQGIIYSNGSSFAVYNDNFYLASNNKLYKLADGITTEIFTAPNGRIYDIKSFKGKLLIAGENLLLNGETYSIINFNEVQFTPVSKLEILGRGLIIENEILFAGFPGFFYNGENVTLNNVYGYISGADNKSNVYVINKEFNIYKVMRKGSNNEIQIGLQITATDDKDDLGGFYYTDNTFVLQGLNTLTNHNITFVLNDNTWEKVEMAEPIIFENLIKYNDRIIGCTKNGELLELVNSK
jgi:hypothetical protein